MGPSQWTFKQDIAKGYHALTTTYDASNVLINGGKKGVILKYMDESCTGCSNILETMNIFNYNTSVTGPSSSSPTQQAYTPPNHLQNANISPAQFVNLVGQTSGVVVEVPYSKWGLNSAATSPVFKSKEQQFSPDYSFSNTNTLTSTSPVKLTLNQVDGETKL